MPDLLTVFINRWKFILALTISALVLTAIVVLLQPKKYLATLTALPASSVNSDKARIFNNNIQSLYSAMGSPDDLDPIIGTTRLDTIYLAVAQKENLLSYYGKSGQPLMAAAIELKNNCSIKKTEYGQLAVNVWDRDPNKAVRLANALFAELNKIHQSVQGQSNALIAARIQEDLMQNQQLYQQVADSLKQASGAAMDLLQVRRQTLLTQIQDFERLLSEYTLMVKANPPSLIAVETPQPTAYPDKPKTVLTLSFVLAASLLFSFLLALFLETKSRRDQ